MRALTLVFAIVVFALAACSTLSSAKGDYAGGRYAEAREKFLSVEVESRRWNDRSRAEYALYRGLTHGAMGDRAAASVWLDNAKAIELAHPGTLSKDDKARLGNALESYALDPASSGR